MSTIDIVIAILLVWGAITGFIKGFVVQVLTLLALVLGVWGGIAFAGFLGKYLTKWFNFNEKLMVAISFAIIVIAVIVTISLLAKYINDKIGQSSLGTWNRIGGVVFGIAKYAFIASVLIVIIERFDAKHDFTPSPANSKLYKPVQKIAPFVLPHLHFDDIKKGIFDNSKGQKTEN